MFLSNLNLTPFFHADEGSDAPRDIGPTGILDILNSGDTDEELDLEEGLNDKSSTSSKSSPSADSQKDKVSKDSSDGDESDESDDTLEASEKGETEEEDELKEIEDELNEEKDEDDELELVTMPRRREILAKYPKIFKDFPQLEQAFFRERQYSEVFPTIADAKDAVEKVQILNNFEQKLLSGDITAVLKAVRDESHDRGTQSFNKVVDTYLPALKTIDEQAYFHVISTVVKGTIYNMVAQARANENQDLEDAAKVLNQFAFGTVKYTPPQPLTKEQPEDNREKEIIERERSLQERQFTSARDGLNGKMEKVFDKAIQKYIDPKEVMTPYVKRTATREAHEHLAKLLDGDSRFRTLLDKAWRVAFDRNFDSDSMGRVEKIIKSRASNVLPAVIRRARQDALRGLGKRVKSDESEQNNETGRVQSSSKGPLRQAPKGALNNSGNKGTNKNEIPKGMSSRDFIMSD